MEKKVIDIPTTTILKIIAIILLFWFFWKILDIIIILFIVLIITATLHPLVDWLSDRKVPRFLAVIIIYLVLLAVLAGIFSIILPPLIVQTKELIQNLPLILDKISFSYNWLKDFYTQQSSNIAFLQKPLEAVSGPLTQFSVNAFSTAQNFFTGVVITFTIFVLTFYLLLEKKNVITVLDTFLPSEHKEKIFQIIQQVQTKWGSWLRGQLLLCLIIFLIDFIALSIIGIPFALALALFAGIFEIVPYIGPFIGAIPAVIVAYFVSPWLAVILIIIFILIQQLESQLLVPKIMQKAVGLSPVITIIALLIGAKLYGILGMILAVPIAAGIAVILYEWKNYKTAQNEENKEATTT